MKTSSYRYFAEPGRTSPETLLIAMSTNPATSIPQRGLISAQTSGKSLQARFRSIFLDSAIALLEQRKHSTSQEPAPGYTDSRHCASVNGLRLFRSALFQKFQTIFTMLRVDVYGLRCSPLVNRRLNWKDRTQSEDLSTA